jgi:hypothetical protein
MIILFVRWDHAIFGMGFPLDYPVLLHRWARLAVTGYRAERNSAGNAPCLCGGRAGRPSGGG